MCRCLNRGLETEWLAGGGFIISLQQLHFMHFSCIILSPNPTKSSSRHTKDEAKLTMEKAENYGITGITKGII